MAARSWIGSVAAVAVMATVSSVSAQLAADFVTPPTEANEPVVVHASFHLRDINEIDQQAETFQFAGVLRLRWHDARLAFDPEVEGAHAKLYLGSYQFTEVFPGWFPQVTLVNESGKYDKPSTELRIEPDGTVTLTEAIDAVGEADLDLRRYPFDEQHLDAVFDVLGATTREVRFEIDPQTGGVSREGVGVPEWSLERVVAFTRDHAAPHIAADAVASTFVVSLDVRRQSFYMIRLVVLPLMLIVILSWSVFWMDKSSVADRINVSFIGILTVVAYHIVISEIWPDISYFTLMHGFLNLSFLLMCATVPINLAVARLDRRGQSEAGDRLDQRCRWLFPVLYFGLNALMVAIAFAFF